MGLVDGRAFRAVVFLQGCPLRCRYCHNPDTQPMTGGTEITAEELTRRLLRFRPYFARGGGVTFSGGEPLMQPEFLAEMLRRLQENGIHTCLDTAGAGCGNYQEILAHTDLVLFDVKHEDPNSYHALTGGDIRAAPGLRGSRAPGGCPHVGCGTSCPRPDGLRCPHGRTPGLY